MRLKGLMEPLINSKEFNNIISSISDNKCIEVEGLSQSSKSYILNGIYEIVKLPKKKKKLRDLTVEEYEKCLAKYCKNGHIDCKGCIFSGTDCSIKFGWINHKDLYSDKFLDQEIEVEE